MRYSIEGGSISMNLARCLFGEDLLGRMSEVGPHLPSIAPELLDTLTGLGLTVGIGDQVFQEGNHPTLRTLQCVDCYAGDDDDD